MLSVLAQAIFAATRIYPVKNSPVARDRSPSSAYESKKQQRVPGDSQIKSMTRVQAQKLEAFSTLHKGPEAFVMPNVWDAGTARILAGLGFQALGTTSAGLAFSKGLRDSSRCLSRKEVIENARSIVEATSLPVSADLEDGFGDSPDDCALTIRDAIQTGLCGGSIEDATGYPNHPIHDFNHAVERIHAAVEAKSNSHFVITARADNFLYDRPDLDDTIRRLQSFEASGADVVYAPGLPDLESIREICSAVSIPVNVVVGLSDPKYSVGDLSAHGVRRVSTGGSLARAALGAMVRAATELMEFGTCQYADSAISDKEAASQMRLTTRGRI